MPTRLLLFLSGSLLFVLFVCFSYLVHKDVFAKFDFDTTVKVQDNLPQRVDNEFSLLSELGSFEVSLVVLFILIGMLLFSRQFWSAMTTFVLFGGFHIIELFGKYRVEHLPPPQFMLRTKQLIEFPQFHIRSEFSYPSGHSGRAAFLSVILILLILRSTFSLPVKISLIGLILGYDLAMWVSRVYLGEHWATDVIGGAMLGVGLGLLVGIFFRKKK